MHSPLIGEGATGQEAGIRAALEQTENVDRLIYIRTHYLAPTAIGGDQDRADTTDRPGDHRHHHRHRGGCRPRSRAPTARVVYLGAGSGSRGNRLAAQG